MHCCVRRFSSYSQLIQQSKVFLLDCDGVVWRGNEAIKGAAEAVTQLKRNGKKVIYITNNSTRSRKEYQTKFHKLGYEVDGQDIFSSSYAAALYLKKKQFQNSGKKVYVIGEQGICDELDQIGISYIGGPDHSNMIVNVHSGEEVTIDSGVGAVVVGMDRNINYYKLQYAQLCLQNPNVLFIATNEDAVAHSTPNQLWAAGGTMVGAVRACSNRIPTVVGKPSSYLLDHLIAEYDVKREDICMIGDRLDTDILFGNRNGLKTLLVLSGVTSLDMMQSSNNNIRPTNYIDSLAHLTPYIE